MRAVYSLEVADVPTEVRVVVPDRPGLFAEITTLAGELGVGIYDIALSQEGNPCVVLLRYGYRG